MLLCRPPGCGLAAAIWMQVAVATAEPFPFHLEMGGATAIEDPQARETSLGFTGTGAFEVGLTNAAIP